MATTIFFRDTAAVARFADPRRARSGVSAGPGEILKTLKTARGAAATSKVTNTVLGPTPGVEVTDGAGGNVIAWISDPVDQAFTLSGTITCNIRCAENNMSANVAINVVVDRVPAATALKVNIGTSARVTEEAIGTETAANFTITPTSTAMLKGDRIVAWIYGDDAGTMTNGFTFTVWYDGPTGGASGDSFLTFTETFGFITAAPAGTVYYPTSDASDVAVTGDTTAIVERKLSKTRGVSATHDDFKGIDKYTDFTDPQILSIEPHFGRTQWRVDSEQTTKDTNGQLLTTTALQSAQSFQVTQDMYLPFVQCYWTFQGSGGSSSAVVELCADNAGKPGTVLASTDPCTAAVMTDGLCNVPFNDVVLLTAGVTYWLKLRRTTAGAAAVDHMWGGSAADTYANGVYKESTDSGSTWNTVAVSDLAFRIFDTRPLQFFTPRLEAFTLSGLVTANLRVAEDTATDNYGFGAELAICNADGTLSAVWGTSVYADATFGEPGTSEAALVVTLSGADVNVTAGQRLRLRWFGCGYGNFGTNGVGNNKFNQPSGIPPGPTTGLLQFWYSGDTGGASGDAFLTLTQTVNEIAPDNQFTQRHPAMMSLSRR